MVEWAIRQGTEKKIWREQDEGKAVECRGCGRNIFETSSPPAVVRI